MHKPYAIDMRVCACIHFFSSIVFRLRVSSCSVETLHTLLTMSVVKVMMIAVLATCAVPTASAPIVRKMPTATNTVVQVDATSFTNKVDKLLEKHGPQGENAKTQVETVTSGGLVQSDSDALGRRRRRRKNKGTDVAKQYVEG